jgi:hypothetical protein
MTHGFIFAIFVALSSLGYAAPVPDTEGKNSDR